MTTTPVRRPWSTGRSWFCCLLAAVGLCVVCAGSVCFAQWGSFDSDDEFELSETVGLDRADSQVAAELERVKAFVADRQWNEAVASLRQTMEQSGKRLWAVTPRRFITIRDYCHLQLAALPPPALDVYRAQVDPAARQSYELGVAKGDATRLRKVVSQAFASRWADDALLALGEMALDSGDAATARTWWERILPIDPPINAPHAWLAFPDTNLDRAAVRARLVLASILEGSRSRAADELAQFERLHPNARGRLGGHDVYYAEALRKLLAASTGWPARRVSRDWPTFAGASSRTHVAPTAVDPGGVAWRVVLRKPSADATPSPSSGPGTSRVDVWSTSGPAFHPIRIGRLVFVNDARHILALKLSSGQPAWGNSAVVLAEGLGTPGRWPPSLDGTLGRPQFTLTAFDGKLYARMGSHWTGRPQRRPQGDTESFLVCIDLKSEGRLLWKTYPETGGWAFEGSPLSDGRNVYVALRRGDIRPQAHVACYDARTGRPRWRRFICAAETPAQNVHGEITHNLLTLDHGMLYYNTNLGAVAALSTDEGQVQWISLYPRRREGNLVKLAPHWGRVLNPCVYHQGLLLVAPNDSQRILALDASTGQILWQTGTQVEDVVHLLGVAEGQLIASGKRLYWIGLRRENQGRIEHVWPPAETMHPQGRGVLANRHVFFPADDRIYVFDQRSARLEKIIELRPKGVAGGNLLVADDQLLIATPHELVAIGPGATRRQTRRDSLTSSGFRPKQSTTTPYP
ncbi:MAG: PQQ-binding-like beta-propeller repeat protein [Pirellulales bacterium]|nr:PQQ-binding-like beta-propeller repeat protein [Pirellulales bacterium]